MESIKALSVFDGRYTRHVQPLTDIFSEYGLIYHRFVVEIQWLLFMAQELQLFAMDQKLQSLCQQWITDFSEEQALRIKAIESTTNHDVKAVEYYIKEVLQKTGYAEVAEWVHFGCTSEDINNTAYGLMLIKGRTIISNVFQDVITKLEELAKANKDVAMMARTHGQPASPTTLGKECINFAWRLKEELDELHKVSVKVKFNGATGNYNAHSSALVNIDWIEKSGQFIRQNLKLEPLYWTTQINPYHSLSMIMHSLIRMSAVLIDLDRDCWGYISLGYFRQKLKDGEIGSSTMPHKVNPIDFENSEGNAGLGISVMEHLSVKLLTSRFQRDLTDSTVLRNLGSAFGYVLIALNNTLKGLSKLEINAEVIAADLHNRWELLAEPIQTIMRVYGEERPYERLKAITRGSGISKEDLDVFIDTLSRVPSDVRVQLKAMTAADYTGLASVLVDYYFKSA